MMLGNATLHWEQKRRAILAAERERVQGRARRRRGMAKRTKRMGASWRLGQRAKRNCPNAARAQRPALR
eukprot:11159741-Lingulodinium_polyedra.AAC.1